MKKYVETELFALLMQSSTSAESQKLQTAYDEFVKTVSEDVMKDLPGIIYGRLSYSRAEIEALKMSKGTEKKCPGYT